jgi:hypothetical protein
MALFELVNEHLRVFAEKAGLEELGLDEDGVCALAFGEGEEQMQVNVEVLPEENRALFHARVGDLGRDPSPEALLTLLDLNLYSIGTNGGALGLDAETGEAILTFAWYFDDLDYSRFEKLLETTYAAATYVRSALPAAGAKHKPAPTMPAPGPGPHRGGQPGMGDGYFVVRG